jgi:hypothetical protein
MENHHNLRPKIFSENLKTSELNNISRILSYEKINRKIEEPRYAPEPLATLLKTIFLSKICFSY